MSEERQRLVNEICGLADQAARKRKVSVATISRSVTKDARFIDNIRVGGNFTIDRYEAVRDSLIELLAEPEPAQ